MTHIIHELADRVIETVRMQSSRHGTRISITTADNLMVSMAGLTSVYGNPQHLVGQRVGMVCHDGENLTIHTDVGGLYMLQKEDLQGWNEAR